MKLSEMFIGQLVQLKDSGNVGKVVDIAFMYDRNILNSINTNKNPILPVVHLCGESCPRKIHHSNLAKVKD